MKKAEPGTPVNIELGNKIRAYREVLGLSQTRLAELSGSTQQTIDRIEKAQVLFSGAVFGILGALDKAAESGGTGRPVLNFPRFAEAAEKANDLPKMPIYRAELGTPDSVITPGPTKSMMRPEPLLFSEEAYGIIVPDNDMYPLFKVADVLLVDPSFPARAGNDILLRRPEGALTAFRIRTLEEWQRDAWIVMRLNPPGQESINLTDWPGRHVIVGKFSAS